MFAFKKGALFISMLVISYIGENGEDYRSFFASWFIFLLLVVIDYIENYNFKKIENEKFPVFLYSIGIAIFSIYGGISLLGSMGLIYLDKLFLTANTNFIIVKGLFLLIPGNKISVDWFLLSISAFIVIFFILEFFAKPAQSYREKHKLKYNKKRGTA
ncbi:hypothetical protein ACFSKI_01595 [Pseudogracilibacillus auburnensis]|uniref:Uncharacterized protein n=1 Tax=Pseudogracilibacillus auburnensis TaxID=1494959 RepID=A0A2V3VGQ1_9BACI|nr:hypothetical protein [Pseudogracilibacillus auburnensis]PXW80937.1 hypothetical protein DFR56_12446 [Pseudogracilibacillus auburnensis]